MCFSADVVRDDYSVPARNPRATSTLPSGQIVRVDRRTPRSSAQRLSGQVVDVVERSPRHSRTNQSVLFERRTPRSSRRSVDVVERSPRTSRQSVQLGRVTSPRNSYIIPPPAPSLPIPMPERALELPNPQPYPVFLTPPTPIVVAMPKSQYAAAPPPAPISPTAYELRPRATSNRRPQEAPSMERERSNGQQSTTSSQGRDRRTTVENERGVIENTTKTVTTTTEREKPAASIQPQYALHGDQTEARSSRARSRSSEPRLVETSQRPRQSFRVSEERIKYDGTGRRTMQYQYQ